MLDIANEDYHEQRYEAVLTHPEIQTALVRHHLHYQEFLDLDHYTLLEQPLPDLAADRIDYTLRDLRQLGVPSAEDIAWFLAGLRVHEGRIVVSSTAHARWFSQHYAYLTEHYFVGSQSQSANRFLCGLLRSYYETGHLTLDDFHQDDALLLARLHTISGQPVAAQYAAWMQNPAHRPEDAARGPRDSA